MNDSFRVRGIQRVGDLDGQRQQDSVSMGRPPMRCFSVIPPETP